MDEHRNVQMHRYNEAKTVLVHDSVNIAFLGWKLHFAFVELEENA
jgi:hypothetical protein